MRRFHYFIFFFNDTATTEIYTLSLHDALPISPPCGTCCRTPPCSAQRCLGRDRKSTRLNSSHLGISYAVFCLKKKKRLIRRHQYKSSLRQLLITVGIRTTIVIST